MAGGDILIDYFLAQQEDPNEEPSSASVQRDYSVDRTFEAINYDLLSKEPINIGMRNGKIVIIDDEDGDELVICFKLFNLCNLYTAFKTFNTL